jgi:hypothetical protein
LGKKAESCLFFLPRFEPQVCQSLYQANACAESLKRQAAVEGLTGVSLVLHSNDTAALRYGSIKVSPVANKLEVETKSLKVNRTIAPSQQSGDRDVYFAWATVFIVELYVICYIKPDLHSKSMLNMTVSVSM